METHADKRSVPGDADDPALWADPFWVALERARTALIDEPRLLHEKKPEWEGGLNVIEINRLAAEAGWKPVFSTHETHEEGLVVAKSLTVYHPGPRDPVVVETWNRYSPVPVPLPKIERVLAHLEAWHEVRASQISGRQVRARAEQSGGSKASAAKAASVNIIEKTDVAWRITFEGTTVECPHRLGFGDIAALVGVRDRVVWAYELCAWAPGGGVHERGGDPSRPDKATQRRLGKRVGKRVADALKIVRARHVALWRHLNAHVRTGVQCTYQPPADTAGWTVMA